MRENLKTFLLILLLTVFSAGICIGEANDFSSLSFEELKDLKKEVDCEFYSRPESGPTLLTVGAYQFGSDLLPGTYYIGITEPTKYGEAFIKLYKDVDSYQEKYVYNYYFVYLGHTPEKIIVEKGNILDIVYGAVQISPTQFSSEGYDYTPPEGTLVPCDAYIVGEDIPAGKYIAYSKTLNGGTINVYSSMDMYNYCKNATAVSEDDFATYLTTTLTPQIFTLEDGNVMEVLEDVIMVKKEKNKLDF